MRILQSRSQQIRTALDCLDQLAIKARVRRARFAESQERMRRYMDSPHRFQYMHGAHLIGKPVELTGREAWLRNRALEEKFAKVAGKDEGERLGRWMLVRESAAPGLSL